MNNVTNSNRVVRFSAQNVALMAVFAALSAIVIKGLPGIPIVGVSGANIKFDAVLAPIYGMLIGPYMGFLAALIGGLITAGNPFDILTSFSPAVSALIAGLVTQKSLFNNDSKIKGWMVASAILGMLILGWYATGIGQKAPFYPVLHFLGLALIVGGRGWITNAFAERKVEIGSWHAKPAHLLAGIFTLVIAYMTTMPYASGLWILPYLSIPLFLVGGIMIVYSLFGIGRGPFALAVALTSYCGIIADHMLGNLVFIFSINVFIPISVIEEYFLNPVGLPDVPSLFMYMVPVSAVERLLFTLVATILGVGLVLALSRANLLTRK